MLFCGLHKLHNGRDYNISMISFQPPELWEHSRYKRCISQVNETTDALTLRTPWSWLHWEEERKGMEIQEEEQQAIGPSLLAGSSESLRILHLG